jgi:hypothetical protein
VGAEGEGKMTGHRFFHSMPWTPADDEQLRSMLMAGRTAAEIATKLKRSVAAVHRRARVLGLSFKRVRTKKLNDRLMEMGLRAIGKKGGKRSG